MTASYVGLAMGLVDSRVFWWWKEAWYHLCPFNEYWKGSCAIVKGEWGLCMALTCSAFGIPRPGCWDYAINWSVPNWWRRESCYCFDRGFISVQNSDLSDHPKAVLSDKTVQVSWAIKLKPDYEVTWPLLSWVRFVQIHSVHIYNKPLWLWEQTVSSRERTQHHTHPSLSVASTFSISSPEKRQGQERDWRQRATRGGFVPGLE